MKRSTLSLLTTSFAVFGVAACGDQPTAEDYDDIATSVGAVLADDSGSEVEAAADAVDAAQGALPSGMTRQAGGHLVGRRGDLEYDYAITCEDAAGQTRAQCEAGVTDRARIEIAWVGQVQTARRTATLERAGDWALTGLTSEVATLDGTGRFDVSSEFAALRRPVTRTFTFDYDATYTGVRIRMQDRLPIGGAALYRIHAERTASRRFSDVERVFDVTADVQFGADGHATVVLDGLRTYDVDLATGAVTAEP